MPLSMFVSSKSRHHRYYSCGKLSFVSLGTNASRYRRDHQKPHTQCRYIIPSNVELTAAGL
jgi:hypothetical protein